jgi:hypothetical protein
VPIRVSELEKGKESISLRGRTLNLLKVNSDLAYTLKELFNLFLDEDKKAGNLYKTNPNVLYKLVYNYLRDFCQSGLAIHKGNYYFYNKKGAVNEKKK